MTSPNTGGHFGLRPRLAVRPVGHCPRWRRTRRANMPQAGATERAFSAGRPDDQAGIYIALRLSASGERGLRARLPSKFMHDSCCSSPG